MFEYHGWVVIRSTDYYAERTETEDTENDQNLIKELKVKIGYLSSMLLNAHFHLDDNSYDTILLLTGYNNHRQNSIIELFEWIAKAGPGSYGILYIQDDEDQRGYGEEFRVWRIARGQFTEHKDKFLSPRIPTTEQSFKPDDP